MLGISYKNVAFPRISLPNIYIGNGINCLEYYAKAITLIYSNQKSPENFRTF